ncbi:MAG: PilZ domain-containing protein [Thiohalophilus sp.]|jgi:hypothetical protein
MVDSERRQFTRIRFNTEAQLIDPDADRQWPTELLDISLRGALVKQPLKGPDDFSRIYQLQLVLADNACMAFEVRIIHSDKHLLGLQFQQMDLDSASHLHRLVELNIEDPALFERELSELLDSQPGD